MRAVALAVIFSACIDSHLVPCGDNACPADHICFDQSCIFPDQLTACTGSTDGTPCTFASVNAAVCVGGVCQPLGCGNGIVTPDEACDDGNNTNGDGCSADCHSLEVCGNGITDTAAGEECDDGNTNDDDGCRTNCKLPKCGDGIVDLFEQCEPGVGPLPVSCVDLGYDFGDLTCAPTCNYDTKHACQHYGWQYVRDTSEVKVAGDHGTIAILSGGLQINTGDTWTTHTGSFIDTDVAGDRIVAATASDVELFDGQWSTLPQPPLPSGGGIIRARLADDGTPFVLAASASACQVDIYDQGAWTTLAEPSPCLELFAFAKDNFAITTNQPGIDWMSGGVRTSVAVDGTPFDAEISGGSIVLYEQGPGQLEELFVPRGGGAGIEIPRLAGSFFLTIYPTAVMSHDLIYGDDNQEFSPSISRERSFLTHSQIEVFSYAPDFGAPPGIYRTRDGRIFGYGYNGTTRLYELGALTRTRRASPTGSGDGNYSVKAAFALDGAALVCSSSGAWLANGTGWTQLGTISGYACTAIWSANSSSAIYLGIGASTGGGALWRWTGASWAQELDTSGLAINARSISGTTSTVYVVSNGAVLRGPGTWTALDPFPQGCAAWHVRTSAAGTFVLGTCATIATVWQLSGTSWTQLLTEPMLGSAPAALYVADDGTIFAAGTNNAVLVGTAASHQVFTGIGKDLAGTSSSDVFSAPGFVGLSAMHWDGMRWSPLAIDPSLSVTSVIATPFDLAFLTSPNVAQVPVGWLGFVRRR